MILERLISSYVNSKSLLGTGVNVFTAKVEHPAKGEIRHQATSASRTHTFFVSVEALPELSGNIHPGSTAYK